MKKHFEIANLPKDKLEEITKFEEQMREEFGEEIVLVAYEECEK